MSSSADSPLIITGSHGKRPTSIFLITKEDFDKIVALLEGAGYKKDLFQENFVQLKSSKGSLLDVDFMSVEPDTLAKIFKESRETRLPNRNSRFRH